MTASVCLRKLTNLTRDEGLTICHTCTFDIERWVLNLFNADYRIPMTRKIFRK